MISYISLGTRFPPVRFDNLSGVDHLHHPFNVGQPDQYRNSESPLSFFVRRHSRHQFLRARGAWRTGEKTAEAASIGFARSGFELSASDAQAKLGATKVPVFMK